MQVRPRPTTVSRTRCFSGALKCVWVTFRSKGTLNSNHHTAVMRKATFMPTSMGIPTEGPPNTTARHAMKGTQEPM